MSLNGDVGCCMKTKYQPIGGAGKTPHTKIRPKAVRDGIFWPFFKNFEKCQQEVADEVIFGVAKEYVGMDVHVKFGDSTLNNGRII